MSETWCTDDVGVEIDGTKAAHACRERLARGVRETWFKSSTGRSLVVVTNGDRAMVMLLQWPEDDGEHLGGPGAGTGLSDGFILSNGQHDTYADVDTAPLSESLQAVAEIIDGLPRADSQHWITDRADDAVDWRIQPES